MYECAGTPKGFSVGDTPSASFTRFSMIPESGLITASAGELLVLMIIAAKVVIEHLLSFCIMAYYNWLHFPKLPFVASTLASQA